MTRRRTLSNGSRDRSSAATSGSWERWQPLGLGAFVALAVTTTLLPNEHPAISTMGTVTQLLWLLLLVAWSVGCWINRSLVVRGQPIVWWMFATTAWFVVSSIVMAGEGQPRAVLNTTWSWVCVAVAFFLACQLIRTEADGRAVAAVMIALAVGLSADGYWQYFFGFPQQRQAYKQDPEAVLADAGITAPPDSPERRQFEDRLESREPLGPFALTNSLATVLSAWMLFAIGVALGSWHGARIPPRVAAAVPITVLLMGGCWVLTKSRTAWAATVLGGLALAWLERRRIAPRYRLAAGAVVLLGLVAIIAWAILVGGLDLLVITESLKSLSYRFEYWRATSSMIGDHVWFGCGPGNFQQFYATYQLPGASEVVADPHNFVLEIAANAGVPALAVWLLFLGAWGWVLRQRWTASESTADTQSEGRPLAVYWGALVGVALAYFPCGFLVGYWPNQGVLFVGLPAAAAALWLWHQWVVLGSLPIRSIAISAATVLVALSAAGGIGFPGVALSFWILVGLSLTEGSNRRSPGWPRPVAAAGVLASLGLVAVYHVTEYGPVVTASAHLARAERLFQEGDGVEAERALQAATQADPYDSRPWFELAQWYHQQWLASSDVAQFDQFREASQNMLRRNRHSAVAYQQYGDWMLAAAAATRDERFWEEAIQAYRQASALHPANSLLHAQLAWCHWQRGEIEAAKREAGAALELDAITPHEDKKLANRRIWAPLEGDIVTRPKAEPIMWEIRNSNHH